MKDMQLEHEEVKFERKEFPITIFCDELKTPDNVGMIFRMGDAFGVEKIVLSKNSPSPKNKVVRKISRSTVKTIPWFVSENPVEFIDQCKQEGYTIVGLEITEGSIPIQEANFSEHSKIVVLCGSETYGISEELLSLMDAVVHIPMYGANSSMNVVNSLSILLYELTNQLNR